MTGSGAWREGAPCGWARGRRRTGVRAAERYAAHPVERNTRRVEFCGQLTHLCTEVQEPPGAVDVVEGCEGGNRPIYEHGVKVQRSSPRHHQPVGVRPTHEHLSTPHTRPH